MGDRLWFLARGQDARVVSNNDRIKSISNETTLFGTIEDCINAGFREEDAKRIQKLLFMNEYKRYQSAPGTRLSKRAFWLDRRYPIVNQWSE